MQGAPACFIRISCARQGKEHTSQNVQAQICASGTRFDICKGGSIIAESIDYRRLGVDKREIAAVV